MNRLACVLIKSLKVFYFIPPDHPPHVHHRKPMIFWHHHYLSPAQAYVYVPIIRDLSYLPHTHTAFVQGHLISNKTLHCPYYTLLILNSNITFGSKDLNFFYNFWLIDYVEVKISLKIFSFTNLSILLKRNVTLLFKCLHYYKVSESNFMTNGQHI